MSLAYRTLCKLLLYPTLLVSEAMCVLGVWRRYDKVEDRLWLGRLPSRGDVDTLADAGVCAVLNMCGEHHGWGAAFERRGVAHLHLPAPDYACPRVALLRRGVDFIRAHASAGETVYVHCKAGRTRAASVVLCYLMAEQGLTGEDAFKRIQRARRQVTRGLWRRKPIQEFSKNL